MPNVSISNQNMASALKIIKAAMRVLNILASGETPEPDEATDFLAVLNGMVDTWAIERLMVFTIQRQVVTPLTNKQVYTLGPGGDFNLPRPPQLPRIGVIILNNPDQPLELPMSMLSDAGWQGIPVKGITSTYPTKCWDDLGFPLRSLSMWPIPTSQVQYALYTWTAIQTFQDLGTIYSFPPGYIAAMKYNLAARISLEFGMQQPPATVVALAQETKARIMSVNGTPIDLACDDALVGGGRLFYDWRTDTPASGLAKG
jgi:hypothetical protein